MGVVIPWSWSRSGVAAPLLDGLLLVDPVDPVRGDGREHPDHLDVGEPMFMTGSPSTGGERKFGAGRGRCRVRAPGQSMRARP